ncbi:MAG: CAP domain-containing protein, partial [Candidatus Paceibacterota bacterium]
FISAAGTVLFFYTDFPDWYSRIFSGLSQFKEESIPSFTEKIEQKIFTPPPLEAEKEAPQSHLTVEGVIAWTNIQRAKEGLPLLEESALLGEMAQAKVDDMFSQQYFAHESPLGAEVGDLAEDFNYRFIIIGENLALGNFQDDQVLVQGWMDSPGHRENILNDRYSEIGVAVGRGVFNGAETWLAVQHFALPLSACPQPDAELKEEIESNQAQIDDLLLTLIETEKELKSLRRGNRTAYNQKVDEYNSLVSRYNELVEQTKVLVEDYNLQVALFNDCASGTD